VNTEQGETLDGQKDENDGGSLSSEPGICLHSGSAVPKAARVFICTGGGIAGFS
jgi:hypothetical protein